MSLSMLDLTDKKTMLMQVFQPAYFDRLKESGDVLKYAKRWYFSSYLGCGSPSGESYEFNPNSFSMTLTGGFRNYDYVLTPIEFAELVEEIFEEEINYEEVYNERRNRH